MAFGGAMRTQLRLINGTSYSVPAASLPTLAADPNVASVSVDHKVHMLLDNTTAAVNAPAAWSAGLDGSGIGIAVIDSGISEHDDLQGSNGSRIVYRQDFVGTGTNDQYGHGEHVAGILAGNGADSMCPNCSRHFVGVAPNANLLDLRVLDQNGESNDSTVIAAIDQAIQLQAQYNVRVINLSLGRPVYESYQSDRGGGGGRQRWPRQLGQQQRLRHHQRARQRSLRHHGRSHEVAGHAPANGRFRR
jgi:serine protease AprX